MKCDEELDTDIRNLKRVKKERDLFGASKPHRSFKVSAGKHASSLLMMIAHRKPASKFGKSTTSNLSEFVVRDEFV